MEGRTGEEIVPGGESELKQAQSSMSAWVVTAAMAAFDQPRAQTDQQQQRDGHDKQ